MCYSVVSGTRQLLKYARHRSDDPAQINELERLLEEVTRIMQPYYYVSGFAHPPLITFPDIQPLRPEPMLWGLIPFWVKDKPTAIDMANKTLNARGETIFELPSFRTSAKQKRCLIYLDAFYEIHHIGKETIPFHIAASDGEPMTIAGLWDEWTDKATGELIKTVTMVTCVGNAAMEKIHNNPKLKGPRMPLILPREKQEEWLMPWEGEQTTKALQQLIKPYPTEALKYTSVGKLMGKNAIGNHPEAEMPVSYPRLDVEV